MTIIDNLLDFYRAAATTEQDKAKTMNGPFLAVAVLSSIIAIQPAYSNDMLNCGNNAIEYWNDCIGQFEFGSASIENEFTLDELKHWLTNGHQDFPMGTIYRGEWIANKASGAGEIILPDGGKINGNFSDDAVNGEATFTSAIGYFYKGNYVNSRPEGYGVEKLIDGSRFEGDFFNNGLSKRGIKTFPSGDTWRGRFDRGLENGPGVANMQDGDVFVVSRIKGEPHSMAYFFGKGYINLCEFSRGNSRYCERKNSETLVPNLTREFNRLSVNDRKKVQKELSEKKYYNGVIDGTWGPNTVKAIISFIAYEKRTLDFRTEASARRAISEFFK